MGQARRDRRMFKRAYDKATKSGNSAAIKTVMNDQLKQLINKLQEDYETTTASK
jgi:hypothetical protein